MCVSLKYRDIYKILSAPTSKRGAFVSKAESVFKAKSHLDRWLFALSFLSYAAKQEAQRGTDRDIDHAVDDIPIAVNGVEIVSRRK